MNAHAMTFRGRDFIVQEGTVHPAYSLACFREDGEEHDFRERFWSPKPGDIIVDAGASYGAYSLTAAVMGAKVLAFEPEPSVFVDLERNCKLNPKLKVDPICAGLWDATETVEMATYAPHWPAGTITAPFQMRPLDVYGLPRLDWLKVDVEGAEYRVLRGAMATLERCQPVCIVECHVFLGPELLERCKGLLAAAGYESFEEVDRPPCSMLIARPS